MSNSPVDPGRSADWLDESLPLPKAGVIWPWILAGAILFCAGLYLLYPTVGEARRDSIAAHGRQSPTPKVSPLTPATAEDRNVLNCIVVDSSTSSFAQAAAKLGSLISAGTAGRLRVDVHPSGQFMNKKLDELSIVDAVRKGQAQMAVVTCSPLANFDKDLEIFDLPFLFRSYDHADGMLLRSAFKQKLLRGLSNNGLVGLGTMEVGFRIFSSSMPLPALSDFNGRKVRVMQSSTAIAMARQLGAEAVPAPVDKIYQMGKEGYIDAADRTYPTYWDFKLYEVQRYITESFHSYTVKVIIMNKAAYDRLSADDRKLLEESVGQVEGEQRQLQRKEDSRVKQDCRKMGIEIFELSPNQRQAFIEACKPVYDEYVKLRGSALLDEVRNFKD